MPPCVTSVPSSTVKLPFPTCFQPVTSFPLNSSIHLPVGFFWGIANAASERNTINPVIVNVRLLKVTLSSRPSNPKSEIALLVLIHNVLTSSHRQRHHRQRGILTADRNEARSVCDEQILDVPALIEPVQHGSLPVVPHPRGSHFVNAQAGRRHVFTRTSHFEPCFVNHLLYALERIGRHRALIVAVRAVDVRRRNPPLVFDVLVDSHAILFSRKHLAPHPDRERRRVLYLANHLLELGAESGNLLQIGRQHPALGAALHPVAADEFRMPLADVSEFWNIYAVRAAVVVVVRILGN